MKKKSKLYPLAVWLRCDYTATIVSFMFPNFKVWLSFNLTLKGPTWLSNRNIIFITKVISKMCMMTIQYNRLLGGLYLGFNLANSFDSRVHAPVDILADSLCVTCQYSSILKHKNKHSIMALVKTYSGLRTYLVQTCLPRSFWHNLILNKQVLKTAQNITKFWNLYKIYRRIS